MSYARRHSTNVCPGNRVRYIAWRKVAAHSELRKLAAEVRGKQGALMPQRDIRRIPADDLFREWMQDIERIRLDIHELFSLRRTFRDVADVFRGNSRLQQVGGHIWGWLRVNYVASVLMRVRRQVDSQQNTVNLRQLLEELCQRPEVVTRGRRRAVHGPIEGEYVRRSVEDAFTEIWVREGHADPDNDHVSAIVVAEDLRGLDAATQRVADVANRNLAHATRVSVEDLQAPEVDAAFDAIESILKKYYPLLTDKGLSAAEAAPQFNTHEVFTFPWIDEGQRRNGR